MDYNNNNYYKCLYAINSSLSLRQYVMLITYLFSFFFGAHKEIFIDMDICMAYDTNYFVYILLIPLDSFPSIKVVPGGSHGYFFEVKVETVKLTGGR